MPAPPWSLSRDALRILQYLQRVDARTGEMSTGLLAVTRHTLVDALALGEPRVLAACRALLEAGYLISPTIPGAAPLMYVGLSDRGKRAVRRSRLRSSSPDAWKSLGGELPS